VGLDFRLRQLQCFLVLADTLNYGRAARLLYLSQPTLTFQIKSLEDALGVRLFDRSRQHVSLTDAGFAFRDYAANILSTANAAREHLNRFAGRLTLRVGCGPVGQYVVLPALIRSLAQAYPDFQLEILELTTEEQIAKLPEGKVDALLMVPELPIPGLRFEHIVSERLIAMVARENPLSRRHSISIHDLKDVGIVATRRRDCRFHQPFLENLFAEFGMKPRIVESPQSCSLQFAYAAANEGVLLVPQSVACCPFPDLVPVEIEEELPRLDLGICSMQTNNSIALRLFRQLALQCAPREAMIPIVARAQSPARPAPQVVPMRREAS
jgi:DNA-binding transcriptional LysR family regulator